MPQAVPEAISSKTIDNSIAQELSIAACFPDLLNQEKYVIIPKSEGALEVGVR